MPPKLPAESIDPADKKLRLGELGRRENFAFKPVDALDVAADHHPVGAHLDRCGLLDDRLIAAHCLFATIGHDQIMRGDKPMCMVSPVPGPITLVEDVWLCGNVVVTANTTIAKGCIIGANAVVTRDTEPNGLYVGIPARRLRDRRRAQGGRGQDQRQRLQLRG